MLQSVHWIERVMLGEIALGVCGLAVAFIGALMLTGRLPLRNGSRIVVGCFVLLSAPEIAAGIMGAGEDIVVASTPPPSVGLQAADLRPVVTPANFDPYAGASLRED